MRTDSHDISWGLNVLTEKNVGAGRDKPGGSQEQLSVASKEKIRVSDIPRRDSLTTDLELERSLLLRM